jgi:hypothetical protein
MPFDIDTTDVDIIESLGKGAASKTCKSPKSYSKMFTSNLQSSSRAQARLISEARTPIALARAKNLSSKMLIKRVIRRRYYSCYSEIRYNFYTYKVEIENVDNINTSK